MSIESGYSPHEEEAYLNEAVDKGIFFGIDQGQVGFLLRALGWEGSEDPLELIEKGSVPLARQWSQSETKRRWEMGLCRILSLVTDPLAETLVGVVKARYHTSEPLFRYRVGFFGLEKTSVTHKITSLNVPVFKNHGVNPLMTTTFSREIGAQVCNPLGTFAASMRVLSLDELPEVGQVGRGQMRFIGLRAWGRDRQHASDEVGGLAILYRFMNDPRYADVLAEVRPYLERYTDTVVAFKPDSSVISPHAAAGAKSMYSSTRIIGDLLYMTHATVRMDWFIFWNTVWRKLIQRVGSK